LGPKALQHLQGSAPSSFIIIILLKDHRGCDF